MRIAKKLATSLCVAMFLPAAACAQYLYQEHYQWRNDDGSESTATWKANADTAITGVTRGTNIRLRFAEVDKYTYSYAFPVTARLEYSTSTSGPWTPVSTAGDGLTAFEMTTTSGYADGDSTTAQLAGAGTFVAGKCVESPNNTSANVAINLSQYSNFEYCFKAAAKAKGSTTYYFRLAGFNYQSYTVYAQLTMAAGEANEPPVIVSPLAAQGSVVAAFNYTILASGSEPITYGASGLPSGLAFDGTNRIIGTPASVGTYSVGLAATSAWGSDAKTLALTVVDNMPPAASNQTANVVEAGEVLIYLAWGDPDTPAKTDHTFTILSGPSQGTLQSYNSRNNTTAYPDWWYYRAALGAGAQSFTWKCRDAANDSNVATCTINVTANHAPVATGYTRTIVSGRDWWVWNVTDQDAGQKITSMLVSPPSHGIVEMPVMSTPGQSMAYYTSAGYVGTDSFTWKCNDGVDDSNVATVTLTITPSVPVPKNQTIAVAKNTTNMFAAAYTGGGGQTCILQKVTSPAHGTAVVTNGTSFLYVPTANYLGGDSFTWTMSYNGTGTTATVTCSIWVKDSVGANDWPQWRCDEYRSATTLQTLPSSLYLQWRRDYPAPAPAWPSSSYFNFDRGYEPVVVGKRLFVPSNKGDFVEALDTDTGAVLWRFYAEGPVRCAPVAYSNKVAFGADDGFLYCLNAADGSLAWKFQAAPSARKVTGNGRLISTWPVRGGPMLKNGPSAGSGQGRIYFAAGVWALDGIFAYCVDAESGSEIWRNDSLGGILAGQPHDGLCVPGGPPPQGYLTASSVDSSMFYLPSSRSNPARLSVGTGQLDYWAPNWYVTHGGGAPRVDIGWFIDAGTGKGSTTVSIGLTAGSRSFTAADASALGVSGTAGSMLCGDGKLFVVTTAGSVYCFGGTQIANPPAYAVTTTPLPGRSDSWNTTVQTMLSRTDLKEGRALVLGTGSGRLVEELAKQTTNLKIVLVDTNAARIASLRSEMDAAGLYGTRVMGIIADPMTCRFPPMSAGIIASEDANVAGFGLGQAFVEKLYGWTRSFGGEVWLPTTDPQHAAIQGWISSSTNMPLNTVSRIGSFTQLKRAGMTTDQATLKTPIGVLWYGDVWTQSPGVNAGQLGGSRDLYTGLSMTATTEPGTVPTMPAVSWSGSRTNPLNGERETRQILTGYGCGPGPACPISWNIMARRGGCHMLYDTLAESGSIYIAGARPICNRAMVGIIGNGVLYEYSPGCSCAYTLTPSSMALVSMPEAEQDNWSLWASKRVQGLMEDKPIHDLGVNFGAPAQRMAEDGVLWLDHPLGDYSALTVPVYYRGALTRRHHHSSRIQGESNRKWVFGSNVGGVTNIRVGLTWPVVALPAIVAPVIDAQLNDACWDGQGKLSMPRSEGFAFTVRYDSTNLYVGCRGGGGDYMTWEVALSDRTRVEQGAAIGMGYWYGGGVYEKRSSGIDSNAWTVAGITGTNGFVVEMAVPWASLEALGFWKEQLVINVVSPGAGSPGDGWCPLFLDAPRGLVAQSRPYKVRLYFAETEGATEGQRSFDVKLQGTTVLSDFDIAQAALSAGSGQAGGVNGGVIREFPNVGIQDFLSIDLVPKTGSSLISGVEILGNYDQASNQAPVAVIAATPDSGASPLTVTLSARQSYDPDGQIAACSWDFGDGDAATGSQVSHTFGAPGTYVVALKVEDNAGKLDIVTKTIVVGAGQVQDFVCAIRAAGGDYDKLSTWTAAIRSDLTSSNSLIFGVSDRGAYAAADDGTAVTFSGGGTGVVKHVNTANIAYIVGCSNAAAGAVTCASGRNFTISDAGSRILHAVADCYNDWPTGLTDNVTIDGWTTSQGHMVKIRAAAGQRHNGTLSLTAATGFTLRNSGNASVVVIPSGGYAQLDGLCLSSSSGDCPVVNMWACISMRSCIVRGGSSGLYGNSAGAASDVINCVFYGQTGHRSDHGQACAGIELNVDAGKNVNVYNCTFSDSAYGIHRNRCDDGNAVLNVANCLIKCRTAGIMSVGTVSVNYTATSDATAGSWGGEGNRTNQTFAFVNEAGGDFHLAPADNGARDHGTDSLMVLTDIDGEIRPAGAAYDIGADEAPATGVDAYGIPDAWKVQYFGSATAPGSGAMDDPDHDGMSNYAEWKAGTIPTNALSRLEITGLRWNGTNGVVVLWSSVTGKFYKIRSTTNLLMGFPEELTNHIPGIPATNVCPVPVDSAQRRYYRVVLE